ncbi:universal stress protein [Peptococcaceae bacterium 1198_IL3148]
MYKHILLAIHGEEVNLEKVMDQTLLLADKTDCQLTLINIKENNLLHYGEVDTLLETLPRKQFLNYINQMMTEQAEKVLTTFKERAQQTGITFNWKTREGKPAEQIIQELKEGNYDLLVLGTKEPGPGNTSSRVKERMAKEHLCTVLMVK